MVSVLSFDMFQVKTCKPAMGFSFAAGTTDGPGEFSFEQGMGSGILYGYHFVGPQFNTVVN